MVGGLRLDAHLLQGQTDLPAQIFAFIFRCDVQIARFVAGNLRGEAAFVGLENVELHFRSDVEGKADLFRLFHGPCEQGAGVRFERRAIRVGDAAEHAHDFARLRPPGQPAEGGGVWLEEQIRLYAVVKPGDGRCVHRNAPGEGPAQLRRLDRDIFLGTEYVAEGQTDKLYVLLLHVLQHFLRGVFHKRPAFFDDEITTKI